MMIKPIPEDKIIHKKMKKWNQKIKKKKKIKLKRNNLIHKVNPKKK